MNREGIAIKKAAVVGLAALGILLIGSVVFFRERVLFADSASFMYFILGIIKLCLKCHIHVCYFF